MSRHELLENWMTDADLETVQRFAKSLSFSAQPQNGIPPTVERESAERSRKTRRDKTMSVHIHGESLITSNDLVDAMGALLEKITILEKRLAAIEGKIESEAGKPGEAKPS